MATVEPMDEDVEMDENEFILNHVVLPRYLPPEKPGYVKQLKLMNAFIQNVFDIPAVIPAKTMDLFMQFERIHLNTPVDNLKAELAKEIRSLQAGKTFAMFVRRQNCTLLIHKKAHGVILATFRGDMKSSDVYSYESDIEYPYPSNAIKVKDSAMLQSDHFIDQLCILYANSPAESSRDYVSKWLITVLADADSKAASTTDCPVITKKVRHELVGDSKKKYFRRSRVYMSTKALLQHALTMELGADVGNFLYKIVMLKFLNQMCAPYTERTCTSFNIDLLSQMMAKLARRIEKLDDTRPQTIGSGVLVFLDRTIQKTKQTIATIRRKIDNQIKKIHQQNERRVIPPLKRLNFESDVCIKCSVLQNYLIERTSEVLTAVDTLEYEVKSYRRYFTGNGPEIESIAEINVKAESNKDLGGLERRLFWNDFENQVLYSNGNLVNKSVDVLRSWALEYVKYAENMYVENRLLLMTSRMILVSMKLIEILDRRLCSDTQYPLLRMHHSGINPKIIDGLLLPQRIDMEIAGELEEYFNERNSTASEPGLVEEKHVRPNSFAVKYAETNDEMKKIPQEILQRDKANIEQKRMEWKQQRAEVKHLREQANSMSTCQMLNGTKACNAYYCDKCRLTQEIDNIKLNVYEHLLPDEEHEQLAIAFELKIPRAIACLRDILCAFTKLFNSNSERLSTVSDWVERPTICAYKTPASPQSVRLGSTDQFIAKKCHVDQPFEMFLVANTSNCIFHANQKQMPSPITNEAIKNVCEPFKTKDEYVVLQWTLDGTTHTENEVLAKQSTCPENLTISEFKSFGTLRADGHRLQLRKLCAIIETEALSFEKESVLALIMQTLWECGVKGDTADGGVADANSSTGTQMQIVRESHMDLLDQEFCSALIERLKTYTQQQENNWMHPFKLLMVAVVAVRIFEVNNELNGQVVKQAVDLLNKIRAIVHDWIQKIEKAIHEIATPDADGERQLRLKLIYVTIIGALTFFVHSKHNQHKMILKQIDLNSPTAPQQWLHFIITLKSNMQAYIRNETQLPTNLRMFLRVIEWIGIDLEPTMKRLITQNPTQIHKLIRMEWPRSIFGEFQTVNFHPIFTELLTVDTIVDGVQKTVTIDIITGSFLVNGLPLSRLPSCILESDVYQRLFGDIAFEVQPDNQHSFSTIKKYSECIYEFKKVNQNIIIVERNSSGSERELIHPNKFKGDFPNLLIENYSHWWHKQHNCIEFQVKKKATDQSHFSTPIDYRLDLNNLRLTHLKSGCPLLDIKSASYQKLVNQLQLLEHPNYMHVLLEQSGIVTIELLRMKLKFKLNCSNATAPDQEFQLESNEFSGMHVGCRQNIGTLYGLNHGLMLESSKESTAVQTKILLIPNGKVRIKCVHKQQHVSVDIDTKDGVRNPPFYQYYVDEFCKQLKSSDCSHASWFYLAYLHAVTSHGEIEPFVRMSGTERALQILQSAFAWSPAPYEPEALDILKDIAKLSPIRKMQEHIQYIAWPNNIPARSAQDSFVFIVKRLYEDSQRLHELYATDAAQEFSIKTDLKCNERDYHRCLQWHPNLRVSDLFIKPKKLRTSMVETMGTSFSQKTQRISILYHTNRYQAPTASNFLKKFLTDQQNKTLNGLQSDYTGTLSKLLRHEAYSSFANIWIDLYNVARKKKCSNEEFTLALSLLAHQNEDMDPILALQAVFRNPDKFKGIKPPKCTQYKICDGTYNDDKVATLLRKYFSSKKHIDDTVKNTIVDELKSQILKVWPESATVEFTKKPKFREHDRDYNYAAANNAINKLLDSWHKRHQLEKFCKKVQSCLKILDSCSLNMPKYDSFVPPAPKNWPKFHIDVEKKIRTHLNKREFVALIKCAHDIWDMKRNDSRERSSNDWWTEIERILQPSESLHLIQANLFPRIVPSLLLPKLITAHTDKHLKALIGAWALTIAHEQQTKRIEIYAHRPDRRPSMEQEMANKPHANWMPYKHPQWLVFEIEQNLTIRKIQIKVAKEMMNPPSESTDTKHSVMQLNMGEGKTSVIIPMLASTLANGDQMCQITVLKALFTTNLKSLRQYLGGMLNQRIYTFPCRRDMPITKHIQKIREIFEECKMKKGVMLSQPDYRLSFQLKLYESIEKGDPTTIQQYLDTHRWINENVRNVLDESDAILQPNYQLIYTMGNQCPPDGGAQRWLIIQALLKRVPYHMKKFYQNWEKTNKTAPAPVEFDALYVVNGHVFDASNVKKRADVFTPCRILNDTIFEQLKMALANDFLEARLDIVFTEVDASTRDQLRIFLTEREIGEHTFDIIRQFSVREQNAIMILSGLLRFEVLKLALTKRWRVNYGVDPKGPRKMAIPFKAKDVPAEMSEFGHPDVAICLTQLSYYYSGLSDAQLCQLFATLESKGNASAIYESWIQAKIGSISLKLIDPTIRTYSGVNLDDPKQRDQHLFPLLRHNMNAIDFWLANIVYPHEAKIFEKKLMCTAWDMCSEQFVHCVTGFSGTNDTKDILPLPIVQNDLKELEKTNENMREILLKNQDAENQAYRRFMTNVSGIQIVRELALRNIPVLLDAGALMLELANKQVAIEWLKLMSESSFDAAVYFDANDTLQTIDRNGIVTAFDCSVYRDNLSRCIVYLDDVHTRGTDLTFPLNWMACVTLAGDTTRDKTVQSCMRMRQLGKSHTICFWASYEADIRLRHICNLTNDDRVTNEHVIEFISSNSRQFEISNLNHWTVAALNYTKKIIGHKLFERDADPESMPRLYRMCVDNELVKLVEMYGDKTQTLLTQIAWKKFSNLGMNQIQTQNPNITNMVMKMLGGVTAKLQREAPHVRQFSHALDEEQQKELEQEQESEEERQTQREFVIKAAKPAFNEKFKSIVMNGITDADINEMKSQHMLHSIADSLTNTQFHSFCQNNRDAWASHLFVSNDFKTVVEGDATVHDDYLRPVMWIAQVKHSLRKSILICFSSYECNQLLPIFRNSGESTLFMYRPRLSQLHNNLIHDVRLHVSGQPSFSLIDINDEAQIGVYAGQTYFGSVVEQKAYCGFLGLIPRPLTQEFEEARDSGAIKSKGFVPKRHRQYSSAIDQCVGQCKFNDSPVDFAIELIVARHQSLQKESHVASILERGINQIGIKIESNDDDDDF